MSRLHPLKRTLDCGHSALPRRFCVIIMLLSHHGPAGWRCIDVFLPYTSVCRSLLHPDGSRHNVYGFLLKNLVLTSILVTWTLWVWFTLCPPLPWASGIPVAIHWQSSVSGTKTPVYTGMPLERELLWPVCFQCFQWSSSGLPVVFQCVPIMQINTGLPLGYHWALVSASVVPVASQCTCGSSGLPVCSNYAN